MARCALTRGGGGELPCVDLYAPGSIGHCQDKAFRSRAGRYAQHVQKMAVRVRGVRGVKEVRGWCCPYRAALLRSRLRPRWRAAPSIADGMFTATLVAGTQVAVSVAIVAVVASVASVACMKSVASVAGVACVPAAACPGTVRKPLDHLFMKCYKCNQAAPPGAGL
eukprot:358657-Chlamydomonas_euryale.AAC.1